MPGVIEVQPVVLTDVIFKLGAAGSENEYQKHVSQVEFVPTASTVVWKGLSPSAVFTFPTKATWVVNVSYAQDWDTTDSLSRYLFDHEGETIPAIFEPVNGVGTSWAAEVVVVPGSIGGTIDTVGVGTVALGVNGRPVPTPIP